MHRAAIAGVAGAAVLAVAGPVGLTLIDQEATPHAWAAPLVRMAEASPRLLIDADGWKVTRADEFALTSGEVQYSNGEHTIQLNWYPTAERAPLAADPGSQTTMLAPARRDGRPMTVVRYDGTDRYRAQWREGGHAMEVDGTAASPQAFLDTVSRLHRVDVDAWLSAMPASVITAADRAGTVDQMLAGVALPPGFDVAALRAEPGVLERYQLGARVTGAVVCAWIDEWNAARRDGDPARAARAVDAVGTSRSWPVLQSMNAEGDWPEAIWETADAMAAGHGPAGGGAKPLPVGNGICDTP